MREFPGVFVFVYLTCREMERRAITRLNPEELPRLTKSPQ